ncbi:HD domain-containing phosphohydrolase [Desulfohalovibrio reitneri]|uniref:HD domain-containing phosphohydrolase n=1 Tax=Desulfohalovibrio reitneri TaxID=1307759 RepID=UPI0004A6BECF|nr:HD domain-containing phosphohydrolase [Desulfohalovibrio reitneri]
MNGDTARVLVVDDDLLNRKVLEGMLTGLGHEVVTAASGTECFEKLDESVDLVCLDVMMPGLDGFACTRAIREDPHHGDLPVLIMTTLSSREDRLKAVEAGANDFISKPIDLMEVRVRTESLLRMKRSRDEVRRYQEQLEDMVQVRTEALQLAVENLKEQQRHTLSAHQEAIHCLCSAAEFKDTETAHHIVRIGHMCGVLAEAMGLPADEAETLRHAAPMHDVGKIGVPDAILLKPGPLSPEEWDVMRDHARIGAKILSGATSSLLETGSLVALTHHEKWDGSGYPQGLAGENIPMCGRITALADVFDALTSARPYKEPFSVEKALDIMAEGRGSHFDPTLYDVFTANIDQILRIKDDFRD